MDTINIGIPTYEGGKSLVLTLKSIYSQERFEIINKIVVVVDGKKLSEEIKNQILHPKLEIVEFTDRKGQSGRINGITEIIKDGPIVLTNDDVILKSDAIVNIAENFKRTNADLVCGHAKPLAGKNWITKALYIGYTYVRSVFHAWNNGETYLACNGRLIALSQNLSSKLAIPETLWNNDAYIYFFARLNGYKISNEENAICYFQNPTNFTEYLKQSQKFRRSQEENQQAFNRDLSEYYSIPGNIVLYGLVKSFFRNPYQTVVYLSLFVRVKLSKDQKAIKKIGFWETDPSTKDIKN